MVLAGLILLVTGVSTVQKNADASSRKYIRLVPRKYAEDSALAP